MEKVAQICNRYPNLQLLIGDDQTVYRVEQGQSFSLKVEIRRDIDEEDFETHEEYLEELKSFACPVNAPYYPTKKDEVWWIIIGNPSKNKILAIKKITTMQNKASISQSLELDFENYQQGTYNLQAYLICDSYVGCDLEKKLQVVIV